MKCCLVMIVAWVCGGVVNAEIDFDTEVVPLLSKAGCNAASCHGGAAGQAGFRLSLFGGDPQFDYRTIVHELSGRRINHGHPTDSLFLAKPTGRVDHGGGEVLNSGGDAEATLIRWIAAGTPRLNLRRLERLEVTPLAFVADAAPADFRLNVVAVFDDGIRRDVTSDAVYVSQNDSAVSVDADGNAVVAVPGRHALIVRFGGLVKSVSVTTPIGDDEIDLPSESNNNWIDGHINATLLALRLAPAPQANDARFIRRLSLDLTGRLPLPSDVERFVQDANSAKRAQLVDRFLASDLFVQYWTHRLATFLRLRKPGTDGVAAVAFYDWLRLQVAADVGWNRMAASLVMSEGDTHQPGAATVHRFFATARDEAEYMSEVLMGVRLRCANCHNHPLDQWTQDDYHGLAAIFARLERGQHVRFSGRGNVIHPRTGTAATARIPGVRFIDAGEDERQPFVDWLEQPDNPYFATAMVNRVWESLMGRGLVSPVDDLRSTNPPSHPDLLRRLSQFFVENDFQFRPLIRLICNSAAYARDSSLRPSDHSNGQFYASAVMKPLSAEVLADAIADVTGVADDYNGVDRAIDVIDRTTSSKILQFLGQCLPDQACSAGSVTATANANARGIASKLHLMNGELLNTKLSHGDGRLARLIKKQTSTRALVHEFYLRAFSRPPSQQELSEWVGRINAVAGKDEKNERYEDFLWAILNCHEFTTNR